MCAITSHRIRTFLLLCSFCSIVQYRAPDIPCSVVIMSCKAYPLSLWMAALNDEKTNKKNQKVFLCRQHAHLHWFEAFQNCVQATCFHYCRVCSMRHCWGCTLVDANHCQMQQESQARPSQLYLNRQRRRKDLFLISLGEKRTGITLKQAFMYIVSEVFLLCVAFAAGASVFVLFCVS